MVGCAAIRPVLKKFLIYWQLQLATSRNAKEGISDDWRSGIAYNAALKLCTALLYAEGYKADRSRK